MMLWCLNIKYDDVDECFVEMIEFGGIRGLDYKI